MSDEPAGSCLLFIPRVLLRYGVVGALLMIPLAPWFALMLVGTSVVHLQNPARSWWMLACCILGLVTVMMMATARPPRPGKAASWRWRMFGWFSRAFGR